MIVAEIKTTSKYNYALILSPDNDCSKLRSEYYYNGLQDERVIRIEIDVYSPSGTCSKTVIVIDTKNGGSQEKQPVIIE